MSKAAVRILKIISLIVWLLVSLLGTVVFYNLSQVKPYISPRSNAIALPGDKTKFVFPIQLEYNGYVFPVALYINITVKDASNKTITSNATAVILQPNQKKNSSLVIILDNNAHPDHGELIVRFGQIIFGYEIITIRINQPFNITGGV